MQIESEILLFGKKAVLVQLAKASNHAITVVELTAEAAEHAVLGASVG